MAAMPGYVILIAVLQGLIGFCGDSDGTSNVLLSMKFDSMSERNVSFVTNASQIARLSIDLNVRMRHVLCPNSVFPWQT